MSPTKKSEPSKGSKMIKDMFLTQLLPMAPDNIPIASRVHREEPTLTPEQKRYVEERLGKYSEDMVLELVQQDGLTVEAAVNVLDALGL